MKRRITTAVKYTERQRGENPIGPEASDGPRSIDFCLGGAVPSAGADAGVADAAGAAGASAGASSLASWARSRGIGASARQVRAVTTNRAQALAPPLRTRIDWGKVGIA